MPSRRYYTPKANIERRRNRAPKSSRDKIEPRSGSLGKTYPTIDDSLAQFIQAQKVFFVGSAPLDANAHVNLSPKGLDTLRILDPSTVAYLDLTGSGIETIAHVKENGRIVLMFCSFEGPPRILRIHGRGRVVEPQQTEFTSLADHFPRYDGTRAVIVVEVARISDSCGYAVPRMKYEGERSQLSAWASKLGPEGLKEYRTKKNQRSIDGIRGLNTQD
jgi:hypothetical protein